MRMKKILSVIIAIAMIMSTMGFSAMAYVEAPEAPELNIISYINDVEAAGLIVDADTSWYDAESDSFTISTATELAGLAKIVNEGTDSFAGKTVTLGDNIDLEQEDWTSIGTAAKPFLGTFDGNNKTISNLWGAPNANGLFGYTSSGNRAEGYGNEAVIKNFTIDGAVITDNAQVHNGAGAVVGCGGMYTTIKNVTIKGQVIIAGARSGGIIGYAYSGAVIDNCHVDGLCEDNDSTIDALFWACGGIMGFGGPDGDVVITNSSVKNIEVNAVKHYGAGGILGNGGSGKVENVTVENVKCSVVYNNAAIYYVSGGPTATGTVKIAGVEAKVNGEVVEITGESLENAKQYVAKIGDEYYETLQLAVKNAQDGDTIVLLGVINEGSIKLPATLKNITFEGNNTAVVKNTVINAADGNSVVYDGFKVQNITFENSRFVLGGNRNGEVLYKDLVFDNNKFLNIVTNGLSVIHMNLASDEKVQNFKFTNNIIDGNTGGNNSGVLIKEIDGEVVFENNIMKNIAWNAIQIATSKPTANLIIRDNEFQSNGSSVLNVASAPKLTISDNVITPKAGAWGLWYPSSVEKGGVMYKTLIGAIEDVDVSGDIVLTENTTLASANIKNETVIDLNGNTLSIDAAGIMDNSSGATAAIQAWNNVTFKNGNISVTSANEIVSGIFYVASKMSTTKRAINAPVLTFDNVKFTVANTNGTSVFVVCEPGKLVFNDSEVNATGVGVLVNGGDKGVADIINTKINVSDSNRALLNVEIDAQDSDIKITNLSSNALRNVSGTINNTNIDADGYENGIKNDSGLTLNVTGDSELTFTGAADDGYDIHIKNGATLNIEQTAMVEGEKVADEANSINGNVASKAEKVYVQYRKVDSEEGTAKYEIVLAGADAQKINELASADLTFDFVATPVTGGNMAYSVAPANGVSLTQIGDRFMFNYNGVQKYEESGLAIVIGTITIEGYGSYTLRTDDSNGVKNAVYATEIRNNIVEGFEDAAVLVVNKDLEANDGMVGEIKDGEGVIAVPTRTLTITIDFPNAIKANVAAYQEMKVEITGVIDGVNQTVEYDLGETMDNGSYVVENSNLVLNNAYTVTVSGEGYRTTRYTVTMTKDKNLRFWNNVMDEAQVVEIGKGSSEAYVTFLAGDIVKDNVINIYDLSAVVSYFGTPTVTSEKSEYVKYDLNRDGVIDSKDVAYILVSWGK